MTQGEVGSPYPHPDIRRAQSRVAQPKDEPMSHTPHELADEFPEHVEKMQDLRGSDAHFAKLYDAYHVVNRATHRAETNVEPTTDDHMIELRKERMQLKDEIFTILMNH